jgi:RHS repeat-associated protein
MKRRILFNRIVSLVLIVVTLLITPAQAAQAAPNQGNAKTVKQTMNEIPVGNPVETKKPVTLPYGILKKEDALLKWTGKKEEIASRTENSKTYLNEDGSKTTLMFFEPIHVKADKNASENAKYGKNNLKQSDYIEINNKLTTTENKGKGGYKNTFGLYDVYFLGAEDTGIRIVNDGVSIHMLPEDLQWDDMEVSENQVFVPSKTDGITYVYTVNSTSLKEDIVLNYQPEREVYSYEIIVANQYEVTVANNILSVEDNNHKQVYYTMSAPYMIDREGNVNHSIKLELKKENGKYLLSIKPDQEWLRDPSRAYPVVIDPTVTISGGSKIRDTYIEETGPDIKQYQRDLLYIGYDDGIASHNGSDKHGQTKSYLKFDLPTGLTSTSNIESATLNLYAYTNWSTEARTINVRRPLEDVAIPYASEPVSASCVTWNTKPDLGSIVSSAVITGRGSYSWNLKPMITEWLNGAPNYGLALETRNAMDPAEAFYSSQGDIKPYIEIKYDSFPEPDPASDEFELVLERADKFDPGTAYAKSTLEWAAGSDAGDIGGESGNINRATIEYTLMPENKTGEIVEENFMNLEWETEKFDLEKDKVYWIEADIKVEQWNEEIEDYEDIYTEEMKTEEFVVAEAQPGDTLKRLAKYYTEDASNSEEIYELNKLQEERLFVGQKLFILSDVEEPYNYDQPDTITSAIMTSDAAAGSIGNPTETVGQFINPVTGALNYFSTDVTYPVYSNFIDFTRSYVSTLENRKSPLGDGWDYNFNKYLMFYKDGKIGYHTGDGTRIYFTKSSGSYTTTAPTYDTFIQKGDEYAITTREKTTYTFNDLGLLTEVKDKNNNITTVEYDENDWQTKITDALSRSITLRYYDSDSDHVGNIKEVVLPDTTTLTFEYESEHNYLASFSDREAYKTTYRYNEDGLITQLIEPEGNEAFTNTYTTGGKVSEQLDGENHKVSLAYGSSTNTFYDGRSLTYKYQFDSKKRVTKKTYPDTTYEAFQYNSKWDVTGYTDTMGRVHKYSYNNLGYLTTYTRPEDQKTFQYGYDKDYLISEMIDFEGNKTSMTYDANDNLEKEIKYNTVDGVQKQITTQYEYTANGLLEKITDADGIITRIDNSNYPETLKIILGGITYTETYDILGRTLSSADGNNNVTKTTYDKNGNVLTVLYPSDSENHRVTNYTYDKNGNQTSVTGSRTIPDAGGTATTTYVYDNNNRIESVMDPYGGMETYSYDGNGNVLSITDQEQNVTTYEYDSNNLLKRIYVPGQVQPAFIYDYDALGNTLKVTEADGDYTEYQYNYKVGQVAKELYPENYFINYTYDDMGNLLSENEPDSTLTYSYDNLYQPVEIRQTGASTTYVKYTSGGRISEIRDEKGIITTYQYDPISGQLITTEEEVTEDIPQATVQSSDATKNTITFTSANLFLPDSLSLNYAINGEVNIIANGYSNGDSLGNSGIMAAASTVDYGAVLELSSVFDSTQSQNIAETLSSAGTRIYKTEYTYDSNGNFKTVKDKEGNTTTYQYNELNEVSKIIDPLNKITQYFYDEDGNVSKTIDGEGNLTLTQYDALNRLYKVMVPEENTTETYLYNSRGLLEQYVDPMGNATSYTYDKVGMVEKEVNANHQVTQYEYNIDDTLKKILYPNGQTEEYGYDGLNRADYYKDRALVNYAIQYTPSGMTDYISDSVGNHVDYRYDTYGRLTNVEDTIGRVTSYTYDSFSRMTAETGYDGNTTTYTYDPYDRIRRVTDAEQKVTDITYDALNNLTQMIQPENRIYSYEYDPSGNLTKVTDPLGNSTQYQYNNNNSVSEIINARGFSKKYEYNALNLVESVTDERDYTTNYDYYPGGLVSSITDPLSNTTRYTYDPMSQVQTITNALYETTRFGYDFFGNTTSSKDSRGVTTTYTYNAWNQLELTYDTENNLTRNEYYANGDLKKTTDQEGNVTEYFYDAIHRMTKTIEPNGLTKNYVYDEVTGDLAKVYDNAGQITTYTYDKMHRLLSETNAQGLVTTYSYDAFGNQTSKTTPDGNTTTYTYDELDRITSIIDPENNLTELAYDPVGNLDYVIKPTNLKYDYTYDPANNLENILDPLGQNTAYTYDGNNNISSMVDPAGNQYSYQYDALNRLRTIHELTGSGSQYQYDGSGNISSFIDGNGNATKYLYNNLNKLESVEDAEGNLTSYTYYKDGNLKTMTDARGNTSNYTYDEAGNLNSFTNPLGEVIQYNYNLLGQIDEEIKADGNVIDYVYDEFNRLESIVYPDESKVNYTYDEFNRKTSMEDANGLTEYAYDDMGRLTWVSDPNGEQISYEYDDKGRKTSVIYPDGKYVDYQYDEFDRIIGVNDREGRITRYTYDTAGRKKTTTLPNGITTTYEYDKANRIISITSVKEDGSTVLKFLYDYDNAGNRTLEEIWQGEKHYKREYTYYKNNTVKSMVESGDNQATYAYIYDASGNIAEKRVTETKDDQTNTKVYQYTYDSANRMITETGNGGDSRTYRYDANGNRIARVLDGGSSVVADTGADATGTVDATVTTDITVTGNTTATGDATVTADTTVSTDVVTAEDSKETADYYYYDYEDRLVEIVIHNGKVFTYGYDGEGNRLWRTYSQYPLVQPPVEEGEQVEDPATFPGYNKNDKDNSSNENSENNENGNGNSGNNNSNNNNSQKDKDNNNETSEAYTTTEISSLGISTIESSEAGDIELISMLSTTGNNELISEVDTYLLNLFSITDDKSNNGNNGNNSGGNNGNSNAGNNGNGSDNSNKNPGDNSNGNNSNSNNNGNASGNNGNGNGNNGNSNNSGNQSDNGKNTDNGNNSENGNGNSNAWKDNGAKVDQEKAGGKTKDHNNKGYDKNTNANGKGYANGKNKDKSNNGKHVGWDKNDNPNTPNDPYDMINPDIFEFTGYINDINQEYTEVLMTTDSEGNYRGAYTYANGERISVEDLGQVEGVPNNPLYYLYDALGTTAAITNMNAGIIDNNRFAPFGEPLSPVAKNSRLTNSPWGYTGESHDIEAGLVYLRARYYEPGTGRFIQQDTYPYLGEIEEPLTRNLYLYSNGNPLNYTDPSGHAPTPLGIALGLIGGIVGWGFGDYVAKKLGCTGWKYWAVRSAVMVGGAIIGLFAGEVVASVVAKYLVANTTIMLQLPKWVLTLVGISGTKTTVLGSYPTYIDFANKIGARVFSISTDVWNKMTSTEQWAANKKFLDESIAKGHSFILSNNAYNAKEGTYFYKEIEYLLSKGYKIINDGFKLIK